MVGTACKNLQEIPEQADGTSDHENAVYSFGLDDGWLQLEYVLTPSRPGARPTTTQAHESFDPSLGQWVYIFITSAGEYGMSYSAGWQGNVKIYGPAAGSPQTWKLVATKISDREFTEAVEHASSDGHWKRGSLLSCTKLDETTPRPR